MTSPLVLVVCFYCRGEYADRAAYLMHHCRDPASVPRLEESPLPAPEVPA